MRYPTKTAIFAILGFCAVGQVAMAADIPVRKAAPAPVYIPYNWSGWYWGAHAGYGWGDHVDGFLGGFQGGFNLQSGNWLWGIEGQWSWTGIGGDFGSTVLGTTVDFDVDWIATLTGRVGLVQDRWLWYVKGGGAWARADLSTALLGSASGRDSGWTVGLGVEYAWGNNWSSKIEYNYMDFGDRTFTIGGLTDTVDANIHVIKIGLNYKFDWGKAPVAAPVSTRY
jgi:outer membrane immunogenic protein